MKEIKMFDMKNDSEFLEQLREKNQILFMTKTGKYFSGMVDWKQGWGNNYFINGDDGNEYDIIDIAEYCILDEFIED